MKLAILSDIHSNIFALEAVIADAQQRGFDYLINLGDILYGPIAPAATYKLLQSLPFHTICGNQDRQIFEATDKDLADNPTLAFILQDLPKQAVEWMRQLPFDLQLTAQVYCCHGTPKSDLIYLLENVSTSQPVVRSSEKITELLAGQHSQLILCGHTHIPRVVTLDNGCLLVNPGSVGLPAYSDDMPIPHSMQTHSHHARYAIAEQTASGWSIQQLNVPYAFEKAVAAAKQRNRLDWAQALATGKVL